MLSKEEIDAIAANVANRMAATMPVNLTIGARLGISVGGFLGSVAHVVGMVPGAGQVCDFGRGVKFGFSNKLTEYQIAEEDAQEQARAQRVAARQAQAKTSSVSPPSVMGQPRTFAAAI